MTYSIHITKGAEKDMERAADYIDFSFKNPQAADSLLNVAEKELGSLSVMPERYALVDDPLLASWGIRFVRGKQYLAFMSQHRRQEPFIFCDSYTVKAIGRLFCITAIKQQNIDGRSEFHWSAKLQRKSNCPQNR